MKSLKKKMTTTEWMINVLKKVDYGKFMKSTVIERRKQKNINI